MILLDQGGNALGALLRQQILNLSNQGTSNATTPIIGMNRHSINVAAPAIECADDRTDDLARRFRYQHVGLACSERTLEVVSIVSEAGRGVCLSPELKDSIKFVCAASSDAPATFQVSHEFPLLNVKGPQWALCGPILFVRLQGHG